MRIIKAETKGLVDDDDRDLAEKADAQSARQPIQPTIADSQPSPAPVVDPVQRVRDH
jgi:sec-independent protein translocase protein TatA